MGRAAAVVSMFPVLIVVTELHEPEAGYIAKGMKVVCTLPRRVAALSVAARVAEDVATNLKVAMRLEFHSASRIVRVTIL